MHDCIEELTNCGRTASLITVIRFEFDWQSRFSRFIHDLTGNVLFQLGGFG